MVAVTKVQGMLDTTIAGPGWVLRRGTYSGEMDAAGLVWLTITPTSRIPTQKGNVARRIGIPSSRFAYFDEPGVVGNTSADKRGEINARIKAAEKAAGRAKA